MLFEEQKGLLVKILIYFSGKIMIFSYIVEDFNNFILIETDLSNPKQNWAKILYNVGLKNIEAVIDRSEPLILIVGIKDIPTNSKVFLFIYIFNVY